MTSEESEGEERGAAGHGGPPGESRRAALLRAARTQTLRARRARPVALAIGMRVRVRGGPREGVTATVLDADYIESRVRLRPDDDASASLWLPFADVDALEEGCR